MNPGKDRAAQPAARAAAAAATETVYPPWRPGAPKHLHSRSSDPPRFAADSQHDRRCAPRQSGGCFLQQVQRRRNGHHRLFRNGACENHGEFRGRSQLFRRQGQRRFHRCPEPGEHHQGRTQAKERHAGVSARQDHLHRVVYLERGARLRIGHGELLAESEHVRRSDHADAGIRQDRKHGRRKQRHRQCAQCRLGGTCTEPRLQRRCSRRSSPRISSPA